MKLIINACEIDEVLDIPITIGTYPITDQFNANSRDPTSAIAVHLQNSKLTNYSPSAPLIGGERDEGGEIGMSSRITTGMPFPAEGAYT